MQKLLVFILVLLAIYWIRRLLSQAKRRSRQDAPGAAQGGTQRGSTRMLACRQCGVHVPEDEGLTRGGHFYCCEEHAREDGAH